MKDTAKRVISVLLVIIILALFGSIVIALINAAFKLFLLLGSVLMAVIIIAWVYLKFTGHKNANSTLDFIHEKKSKKDDVVDSTAAEEK